MSDDTASADRLGEIDPLVHAIGSLVLAAVGLVGFMWVLMETETFSPGARAFPRLITTVGLLACLVCMAQSARDILLSGEADQARSSRLAAPTGSTWASASRHRRRMPCCSTSLGSGCRRWCS